MNHLEDLFIEVAELGASELILFPFSEVKYRSAKGWENLSSRRLSSAEVREQVFSIIPEKERILLSQGKILSGSVGLSSGRNISYQVYKHKLGFAGSFKLIRSEFTDADKTIYSENLLSQSVKGRGLVVITGPSKSGRSHLLSQMIHRRNCEMIGSIGLLEDSVGYIHQPEKCFVAQFETEGTENNSPFFEHLSSFECVALDLAHGFKNLKFAIELVESGKLVFLTLPVDSFSSFINRVQMVEGNENQKVFLERLSSVLLSFVNLRLLSGTTEELISAPEILFFNANLKEMLRQGDASGIEKYVLSNGEKLGMRTLNQTLANLCVRRKIDLKTAFIASYDPEGLDQLFSKLGV